MSGSEQTVPVVRFSDAEPAETDPSRPLSDSEIARLPMRERRAARQAAGIDQRPRRKLAMELGENEFTIVDAGESSYSTMSNPEPYVSIREGSRT
jgi:hypothetical protein